MPAQRQVELYHPGKLTEAILEFDRSRTSSGSGATKGLEIERELQGKVGPEAHLESAGEEKRARGSQSRAVEALPARKKT